MSTLQMPKSGEVGPTLPVDESQGPTPGTVHEVAMGSELWPDNLPTTARPIMRLPNGILLMRDGTTGYEVVHGRNEFIVVASYPLQGSQRNLPFISDPINAYTDLLRLPDRGDVQLPNACEQFGEKYPTIEALIDAFGIPEPPSVEDAYANWIPDQP